jgi:hypothetical protein
MSWNYQMGRSDTETLDNLVVSSLTGADNDLKTAVDATQIMRVKGLCLVAEAATDYRFYSRDPNTLVKTYLTGKITLAAAGSGGPVGFCQSGWFETEPGHTFGIEIGAGALSGHVLIQYV